MRSNRPVGTITRGTTNANRLRRIDRWVLAACATLLRDADDPLVVDLGHGASPVTTLELHSRLLTVRPDVEVVGLEIDPARVAAAGPFASDGVRFQLGGFELGGFELGGPALRGLALGSPLEGRRPVIVRAANVLRQYDETEVGGAWSLVTRRLAAGGLLVDATCDEVGRRAAWIAVGAGGPLSLTLSLRLAGLVAPSEIAERLPKWLIHRNVPGERVHAFLSALDGAWERHAPMASFGARQRWMAACQALKDHGWPLLDGPGRWRLGELTIAHDAVGPGSR